MVIRRWNTVLPVCYSLIPVDRGRVLQSRRQPLCDTLSRYAFININVDIFFFAKFANLKRNIQGKLQVAFCNIAVGKDPLTWTRRVFKWVANSVTHTNANRTDILQAKDLSTFPFNKQCLWIKNSSVPSWQCWQRKWGRRTAAATTSMNGCIIEFTIIKKPNVRACCSCWMFGGRICFVMDDDNFWLFPIAAREKQPLRQLEGMDFKYHQMPSMQNLPLWHNFCDENTGIQFTCGTHHSGGVKFQGAAAFYITHSPWLLDFSLVFAIRFVSHSRGKNVGACFRCLFPVIEDVVFAAVVANLSHVRSRFCINKNQQF